MLYISPGADSDLNPEFAAPLKEHKFIIFQLLP